MAPTINVCITGAAGQIAYSLIPMVCKGEVFGKDQKINLSLLDIPPMMTVLKGVEMEMLDCSYPLVDKIVPTADATVAFQNADAVFLVGAMPRKEGMERKDLLAANVKIFEEQGRILDKVANKTVKILVVGNPANTNAAICKQFAPSIPQENFSCLTRLDQNRAQAQIAAKLKVHSSVVKNVIIWGNHSSTQFPDVRHATVEIDGATVPVYEAVKDDDFIKTDFIKTVQQRGAAVIKARGLSSAMSAAKASGDHMRDWWCGTQGRWVSMGVFSGGVYNIPSGVVYSVPVTIDDHKKWTIVKGLDLNDFAKDKMAITAKELVEEKEMASAACSQSTKS